MPNNKAQFGQDVQVLHAIYKGKRGGFFVEIGAYDGVESSNTYLMEKEYDWKGICVECNPRWVPHLRSTRNCQIDTHAMWKTDGSSMEFYDSGGFAGLVETNNHAHITRDRKITVTTKKLTTLLDECNAPRLIEFLSIDTEGSEFDILNAHDFDKYTFGYICVEHNHVEKNRTAIRQLLESKGYVFVRANHVDDDYMHPRVIETLSS